MIIYHHTVAEPNTRFSHGPPPCWMYARLETAQTGLQRRPVAEFATHAQCATTVHLTHMHAPVM